MAKISKSTINIEKKMGMFFMFVWAVLIIAGIVAKRIYNLPELMIYFHLPAAVFLVLGFYKLSAQARRERSFYEKIKY